MVWFASVIVVAVFTSWVIRALFQWNDSRGVDRYVTRLLARRQALFDEGKGNTPERWALEHELERLAPGGDFD